MTEKNKLNNLKLVEKLEKKGIYFHIMPKTLVYGSPLRNSNNIEIDPSIDKVFYIAEVLIKSGLKYKLEILSDGVGYSQFETYNKCLSYLIDKYKSLI